MPKELVAATLHTFTQRNGGVVSEQNYSNHRRWVTGYHVVATLLYLVAAVSTLVFGYRSLGTDNLFLAFLLALIVVLLGQCLYYVRTFALKAQDRAIRAEENLRHFVLEGRLLDRGVRTRQVIGLRFASDDEFPKLAARSVDEGLSEEAIKKAVRNWRADYYRV